MDLNNIVDLDIDKSILKKRNNNIYLSDKQIDVLNKYDINYMGCTNIGELIFMLEEILNEEELEDLEKVSMELSEYNYYHNTDK